MFFLSLLMVVIEMCVALPGRILSIDGMTGTVDFQGNILSVNLGVVKAGVGDYVLVHAGCAIEVMKQDMAEELLSLFAELEKLENESGKNN